MFHKDQQIGNYTLIRKLGKGGFGEVWLAERKSKFVTTKVAVKLPLDEQVDHEAIKQEAQLWEQASGHPNILPIIDADEYDGQIVIVSEYAPDGSLDEWLKRNGVMPIEKAVEMTIKILDGLEFLHSRNIIHRDLKPANILLQGDTPRLADFGISRALRTTASSQSSNVSGTFAYMSPEGFDGKCSIQTDVWSVGVNLYQFLTGMLPFPQKEPSVLFPAIIMREFAPLPDSIPQSLKNVVAKALAKLPENRYKNVGEMRGDLQNSLNNISLSFQSFSKQPTSNNDFGEVLTSIPRKSDIPTVKTEESEVVTAVSKVIYQNILDASLIPYRRGNKWGFCDKKRNIFIEPKYDSVSDFSEGLARVSLNDKWGFYTVGFVDKTGQEIIPIKHHGAFSFNEGIAGAKFNNKWGFIDRAGQMIVLPQYQQVSNFNEGLAGVKLNEKWGFINKKGAEVTPLRYKYISFKFNRELSTLGLAGFNFSEGLAAVQLDNKWGFIDKMGRVVIPLKFQHCSDFYEGIAKVRLNNKVGFIGRTGQGIMPLTFEETLSFSEGLAGAKLEGKWGFINKNGHMIISPKYGHVSNFSEGLAVVKMDNRWGFIDKTGRMIVSLNYKSVYGFNEGLAGVEFEDEKGFIKWGFIDKRGEVKIPLKYSHVSNFVEGLAIVKLNDKVGYIGKDGTEYFEG